MHFLPRWWRLSAKRFVEHCAEAVDIGAMIYRRVEIDLLWRHIVSRALGFALPGKGDVFDKVTGPLKYFQA